MTKYLQTLYRARRNAFAQISSYQNERRKHPKDFGNDAFGNWDSTSITEGPAFIIGIVGEKYKIWWGFHKHEWASRFIYVIGDAVDARGERTVLDKILDIRQLPESCANYVRKISDADNYFELVSLLIEHMIRSNINAADYTSEKLQKPSDEGKSA